MQHATVNGTKVRYYNPKLPVPSFEIDYGQNFLWATPVEDGIIIAYSVDNETIVKRKRSDNTTVWMMTYRPANDVVVADDCRSLIVNGALFQLPGKLRCGSVWPTGVVVTVFPDDKRDGRNLYRYNLDGTLRWRVAERRFQEHVPFWIFYRTTASTIKAEGGTERPGREALGAIIDYESGEVFAQEDPR
jgi:hypothetical protein